MSIDPKILELLVCPETRMPLSVAPAELIAELNARIAKGDLQTHDGKPVSEALNEGLLREDRKCLYRVDDDIPNLLTDDRIDL